MTTQAVVSNSANPANMAGKFRKKRVGSKLFLYEYNQGAESFEIIQNYASRRYPRWLDYSNFHCSQAGIADESGDVLNETLLSLFSKDFDSLVKMYQKKKNGYTELDFYVLQMVKLNAKSPTAPYKHKYKDFPFVTDIDFARLEIEDEQQDLTDESATILKQFKLVKYVFEGLSLTESEKKIFEHRFLLHNTPAEWTGPENTKTIYDTFNMIKSAIHEILYEKALTNLKPKNCRAKPGRRHELVQQFLKTHKVHVSSYAS